MTTYQEAEPSQRTILVSLINHTLDYAVTLGLNRASLMHSSGLCAEQLGDPEQRLPAIHIERLVERVVSENDDPLLPLKALRHIGLEVVGVVGHLMQHSATLGQAIEMQLRYRSLIGDLGQVLSLIHI